MFDAVMRDGDGGRPQTRQQQGREPGQFVCQGVCVASDAINSLDAIPTTLSNIEHARCFGDSNIESGVS